MLHKGDPSSFECGLGDLWAVSCCDSCWQPVGLLAGAGHLLLLVMDDLWAPLSRAALFFLLEGSWTRGRFSHCCLPYFWEMWNALPAPQFRWNGNFSKAHKLWHCSSRCPLCRQRITESVRLENRASSPTVLSQFEVMVTAEASGQVVVSSFLAQLGFLYICEFLVPLMSAPDIETIRFPAFQLNKNVSRWWPITLDNAKCMD